MKALVIRIAALIAIPAIYWLTSEIRFDISNFAKISVPVVAFVCNACSNKSLLIASFLTLSVTMFFAYIVHQTPDITLGSQLFEIFTMSVSAFSVALLVGVFLHGVPPDGLPMYNKKIERTAE